ncbi:uncharacterized protein B0H18DRAFT_1121140 [Fomitopsis serialis]|uniref:uncharacterized protein n=1 Tax=Fomitopsis serialis TaxID=139415 RepID=UPI002008DFFD|nr:uncharacterized protein B0H18DRAFT_1121140 [Neoantrodia serialis]KAH9922128.1 hypothetical protein B0H18DRAFT_1121140 [Neoantrodia serialis]
MTDGLTLTRRRLERNEEAELDKGDVLVFNPSVTSNGGLSEAFRIFVNPSTLTKPPAIRRRPGVPVPEESTTVMLFQPTTDPVGPDVATNDDEHNTFAAFFGPHDRRNGLVTPTNNPDMEVTEPGVLSAAMYASEQTPLDAPLHFLSTNNILSNLIFDSTPLWEAKGWIGVPLAQFVKPFMNRLRQRARQDASGPSPQTFHKANPPARVIDPRFELTGAKLSSLTQALAYRGIIEQHKAPQRRQTEENLAAAKTHMQTPQMRSTIWMSTRHKDFSRPFAVFLWKIMHGGLKCGAYWNRIQGYEDRAMCSHCGAIESIQHILFECEAAGQSLIWSLVRTIWEKKGIKWPSLSATDILTLGLTTWVDQKGRVRQGATRLWRVLISEAVHLIWKLRCDRVIGHAEDEQWEHRETLVWNKLQFTLNSRLALDVEAVKRKYGGSALKRDLVLATWNKVLRDEPALPMDWTAYTGFLVGRTPALRVDLEPD